MRITDLILALKAAREDCGEIEVVFEKEHGVPAVHVNRVRAEKILTHKGDGYCLSNKPFVVLSEGDDEER